ncbi:MAG: hypothetical protein ACI845_003493 [Gammaproteobacteria bacterium]|jgi:hypothetical protein
MNHSKVIVFSGPSIDRENVEKFPGFEWRPPVAQGDLLRAVDERPDAIAIIDGYFDGVPSVWHKEVLWALTKGIKVFGASSMGALRDAELDSFGMIGIGWIYQQYRDGVLEDGDEVAVLLAPGELNFKALSIPMVNTRATLDHLKRDDLINTDLADILTRVIKSIFYQQRTWSHIFEVIGKCDELVALENEHLKKLMLDHYIDMKKVDAASLLEVLGDLDSTQPELTTPEFHFEWIVMWDYVYQRKINSETGLVNLDLQIIDELRLNPELFKSCLVRVQRKQLALVESARRRVGVERVDLIRSLKRLRDSHQLFSRSDLDDWMLANRVDSIQLESLLKSVIEMQTILSDISSVNSESLIDELRLNGSYSDLKSSAERKATLGCNQLSKTDPMLPCVIVILILLFKPASVQSRYLLMAPVGYGWAKLFEFFQRQISGAQPEILSLP